MNNKISYGGIGCAICIFLLAMSVYLPSGKIALVFAASLVSYVVSRETDRRTAAIMYVGASLLSMVILFSVSPVIILTYVVCFGNYPVVKTFFDTKPTVLQYILKFIAYTVYGLLVYLLVAFFIKIPVSYNPALLYIGGIFVFAGYDYLLSYAGEYMVTILNKNKS